jgi:hypothetical protein
MRGRAYRVYQMSRARARAVRYLRWRFAGAAWEVTPRQVTRYATDRTPCSCFLCGNPRRHTGERTRQEAEARGEEGRPNPPLHLAAGASVVCRATCSWVGDGWTGGR